jgi:hypothetical protein
MQSPLFKTVCYGLAVAMGVAVIVTNIISPMAATTSTTLLALGLAVIGLAGLQ